MEAWDAIIAISLGLMVLSALACSFFYGRAYELKRHIAFLKELQLDESKGE